jgi:murein DD-endopeptidase MepM/ murein hydrolase activator NlpD
VNFTGNNHEDYAKPLGTPVYAMCDGIFHFAYTWVKKYQDSPNSYLSLGRGIGLTPNSGWKTADGRTPSYIQYGHLSKLNGYSTPSYVERCEKSESGSNYSQNTVSLEDKAVKCGDLIGYIGNSGNTYGSTGIHLHILLK